MTAGHRPIFILCGVKIFSGSARSAKPMVMGNSRNQISRSIPSVALRLQRTPETKRRRFGCITPLSASARPKAERGATRGAAPGHLPEQCEGYHLGNDRPVRGGPAALIAARRARKHADTREPAAGTSYLLCTDPTGCAGLSRTPPGG